METKQVQNWLNSYSVKMVVVAVLALFLLIPNLWIQDIIKERMKLKNEVESQLSQQWGKEQVVSGLVLNIPYTSVQTGTGNGERTELISVARFLPEELKIQADIVPEIRKRGIYKIPVYRSQFRMTGRFVVPDFSKFDFSPKEIKWDGAYFTMGITDLRGIHETVRVTIDDSLCNIEPGVPDADLFHSGITIQPTGIDFNQELSFEAEFSLNGSSSLLVEALGKVTSLELSSSWINPSFIGSFLPLERKVDQDGFKASWVVTHLNRNFPQQWTGAKHNTHSAQMGVELLMPVDHYQKTTRSSKYAILFIALNFIVFLFIEIRNKKKIHPFQYSLVAFALLLFYTLLTSIGEQIGFNLAYVSSALVITLLISWYAYSLLGSWKQTAWVAGLQSALYLFLFTILQLNDYALLMGSLGLLIILGLIMKASQSVKWYNED